MLEGLRQKITRLIALYEAEKQRADALESQLSEKQEEVRRCKEQIISLNLQVDNLKLKTAFLSGEDNAGAKEKIDSLVREIDKCIRLLEN